MLARLLEIWTRYRHADRRQLPLFPDWERAQWLMQLPSVGAALGLIVLYVVSATWATGPEPVIARAEPVEDVEEVDTPEYDLAAIPDSIKAAAERHHLPESLISAVIFVESGFDHAAVSSKGARGLMQLMPATSAMIGVSDPHNPDQNIDAGASHLRAMLDTFKGDLPLALAAYNAGEQNVVRYHGIPPFPETRQFVARVLRRMGDKKTAQIVLAKPIPEPQWVSRSPRPAPKAYMVSPSAARPVAARPTMVRVPTRSGERGAAQLVLHDLEQRPSARTWAPVPAAMEPADGPPSMPDPTAPIGQSP